MFWYRVIILETDEIRLNKFRHEKIVRVIICLCINAGKQTDHLPNRTVCIVRLFRYRPANLFAIARIIVCLFGSRTFPEAVHSKVYTRKL